MSCNFLCEETKKLENGRAIRWSGRRRDPLEPREMEKISQAPWCRSTFPARGGKIFLFSVGKGGMTVSLIVMLITIGGAFCWVLLRKRPLHMKVRLPKASKRAGPEPADQPPRRPPEFIEDLRRREQSMKAETVEVRRPEFDLEQVRRRERELNEEMRKATHDREEGRH